MIGTMSPTEALLWGVDLGGTKIEIAVIADGAAPTFVLRKRIRTESDQGYAAIVDRVGQLVESTQSEIGHKPHVIGFGTPGISDSKTALMKNCNTVCLNTQPLHHDLEKRLGLSVRMANDANCFALAEARFGAACGYNCVFGVILGTGVGGGIVVDQHSLSGHHGICGEWGHNIIEPEGPSCYCGKRGCVERMISGSGLEAFYKEKSGKAAHLEEIIAAAQQGEELAKLTLQRLIEYFGRALAVVVNILDPDAIVLGGGVSNIESLYTEGVAAATKYIFNDSFSTPVLKAKLGDSAGVLGAALLSRNH